MMVSWSVDEKIAQSTVKAGPAFVIPGQGGNRYRRSFGSQYTDILRGLKTMNFKIVTLVLSAALIRNVLV